MQRCLVTTHMHVLALILSVLFVPVGVYLFRTQIQKKPIFSAEENNQLRLDVATLVPVGVLLWNLSIYYLSNSLPKISSAAEASPTTTASLPNVTFEVAVAAAGESTVALAVAIIFCRLFGGIWTDLSK
jgi:hypothetical protein